jgi:PKD repeat protein
MRISTRSAAALIATAVLLTPLFTSAQSLSDLQNQIADLLARIEALQAQLGIYGVDNLQGGSGSAPATPVNQGTTCTAAMRILKSGMSGADVTRLQQLLAADPSVYPEGLVTGYYGELTVAAVQRWQASRGIVSSGSPEATGYGQVGPRTAAAMGLACGGGGSGTVSGSLKLTPVAGNAPLTVTAEVSVNLANSCDGATYSLEWGDGIAPQTIAVPAGTCAQRTEIFTHTYTYGGTYTLKLSSGRHQSTSVVQVTGTIPGTVSSTEQRLIVSPTSGVVPLSVNFSGVVNTNNRAWVQGQESHNTIDFGDGSSVKIPLPTQTGSAQTFSVVHTYTRAGSFQAVMYEGNIGASTIVGNRTTIQVSETAASQQKVNASPTSGVVPLSVHFSGTVTGANAAWNNGGTSVLDFGDGTSVEVPIPASRSGINSFTVDHSYASAGTYTAKLYQGRASDGHALIGSVTITVH